MPVPTLITDLDTVANNNSPPGTESAKGNIDNYIRTLSAFIKQAYNAAQNNSLTWAGTAGGTVNALTLTLSPAITAISAGQRFAFKSGASPNSAATTVAISGLTAIAAQVNGAACAGGEIAASKWYEIIVDASLTSCQLHKLGRATLTELGISAFAQTILDDADASTVLTTLGVSTFIKTLLDDADAATARTTLGVGNASTSAAGIAQLATNAEAVTGTDALKAITPATMKAGLNATGSAPTFAARAKVNFNGTTNVINGSGNVSSITKNATGDYTINFTTAMPDAFYTYAFGVGRGASDANCMVALHPTVAPTASAIRVVTALVSAPGTFADMPFISVTII